MGDVVAKIHLFTGHYLHGLTICKIQTFTASFGDYPDSPSAPQFRRISMYAPIFSLDRESPSIVSSTVIAVRIEEESNMESTSLSLNILM